MISRRICHNVLFNEFHVFCTRQALLTNMSTGSMKRGKDVSKTSKKILRGSKSAPLCAYCHERGHYRTSCPVLAKKVLKAVTQRSSVQQISRHVDSGKPLLFQLPPKSQRTLKRASGKRGFQKGPQGKSAALKKKKRKSEGKKRHAASDSIRKPKANKKKQPVYRLKEVSLALRKLRTSGWLTQRKHCVCGQCGDKLVDVPVKASFNRGYARAYMRCVGCRRWYDAVAFSCLPVLKLPLPTLLKAMQRYFHGPFAESVQSCAVALGLSGTPGTSCLSRLWNALRAAEVRCMESRQKHRTLSGQGFCGSSNTCFPVIAFQRL